jgi:hypothetical protein
MVSTANLWAADEFAVGEALIRFKDSATAQEIAIFERTEALTFLNEIQTIKVRLYRLSQSVDVKAAVASFSKNPIVDFAEPNYSRDISAVNDPSYPNQWSLHNTGQRVNGVSGLAGVDIRWPEAMALFKGIKPITVAVIDSGVALDHPEVFANVFTNSAELTGVQGVDDDRNGYVDDFSGYDLYAQDPYALDEFGHGTLVAGIIAGVSNNGIGGAGISPTAKIMSLRVLNQFGRGGVPKFARVSDVALALDYSGRKGVKIVNLSLGGSTFSSTELLILQALNAAGVLVVAAAGNGGDDLRGDNNDVAPIYPASYAVNNIIAVAAQDRSAGLAPFSNFGAQRVHIAAPGTQIFGADVTRRTVFSQNFNGSTPGWITGNSSGNLALQPWNIYNAPDSFLVDRLLGSTYSPFTNTWVRSPLISLAGALGAQLTFDSFFDLADDILWSEASADAVTWFPYSYLVGTSNSTVGTYSVDISDFDGASGYLRFRLTSNGFLEGIGVFIDNVVISSVTVFDPSAPRFTHSDGTSFAAPMVAGVAALVMSQRPDLNASQVRSIILNSARPVAALIGKVSTGGMLDAERALQLANSTASIAAPSFATQPTNQNVTRGANVSFTISASGTAPLSYQWLKNGTPIVGATNSTLTLTNVQSSDAASYTVTVTNAVGSVTSNAAALTLVAPRISGVSVRTTLAAEQILIVGVNVAGGSKPALIRAAGPGLGALGVPGTMADPKLALFNGQTQIAANDNWAGNAAVAAANAALGAFPFPSAASLDAALVSNIDGGRTVQVSGPTAGNLIVEVYDAGSGDTPRLTSVSALNRVGTGGDILIAGFTLTGSGTRNLLIRGVGPSLGALGVPGVLADPKIELFTAAAVPLQIGGNDNYASSLAPVFASVGSFALVPGGKDAAFTVSLPAGGYTVQVSGADGGTGTAIVEIYELP